MAHHSRALQAWTFMQQCRQQASIQVSPRLNHRSIRSISDSSSLNPQNFGKRLRLTGDPAQRLPELSGQKQEAKASTLQSQVNTTHTPDVNETTPRNPYDFPRARDLPVPRYRHNPAVRPGLWSFLKYRVLRIPEPPNPNLENKLSFNVLTNPYRARKQWPPVLKDMGETQQFYYEKKFRRRLLNKTKAMRFNWDTWALFLRRFTIGFVLVYFAVISEPSDPDTRLPSDGLRYWLYGQLRKGNGVELGGRGPQFWPIRLGQWFEDQYDYYRRKHKRQWDPYNHEGWDETRPRNSLPGVASPPVNRPLEDPSRSF